MGNLARLGIADRGCVEPLRPTNGKEKDSPANGSSSTIIERMSGS